jgi:hypothetical protein
MVGNPFASGWIIAELFVLFSISVKVKEGFVFPLPATLIEVSLLRTCTDYDQRE